MGTPPIHLDEARRTIETIEALLKAGSRPPGCFGPGLGALRLACRELGIAETSMGNRLRCIKRVYGMEPDWTLYQAVSREVSAIPVAPPGSDIDMARQGWAPDHDLVHEVPTGMTSKGTSIRYDGKGNVDQYWNKTKPEGRDPGDVVNLPDPKKITKVSTLYDQSGRVAMQWVAEKPEDEQREKLWREFAEELATELPRVEPRPVEENYSDQLMSVIPFGDPHFGLYCWAEEVGNDFDLDIAKRDLCGAVAYLVSQSPKSKRCLIANLGDFYHADNLEGRTARSGHVLDMDTRLPKVIRVGVAAMRQSIETALTRHEIVEVVNAIGNHDAVLSMALSVMLANVYENEPRVVIHDAPTRRHYVRHGKTLIGITHGDRTKDSDLPGIMATERSEDWGLTKHRYYYRGHHHHDTKTEYNGCIVEQFRTLAPGDAYAVGGGWLSGRDMKLIVHHTEYGEVARTTCAIDMLRGAAQ